MLKKFAAMFAAVMLMMLAILPVSVASADSTMYIDASNGGAVNVRVADTKASDSLCQLGVGFPVTVHGAAGEWTSVTAHVSGKKITGFVMTKFLTAKDPAAKTQKFSDVSKTYTVKVRPTNANGQVHLRAAASKHSDTIRMMNRGEKLTVVAVSHAWYKVEDANGNVGYVVKAFAVK